MSKYFRQFMEEITSSDNGVTVSEIARALDVSRPTADRILQTFDDSGIVTRDPETKRFFLTPHIYTWAARAIRSFLPSHMIRQEIAYSSNRLQRPIVYGILRDDMMIALERTEVLAGHAIIVPDGRTVPWTTASGKVIVAFMAEDEQEQLLAAQPEELQVSLRKELAEIRKSGYCEYTNESGGVGIAAPLFGESGLPVACLILFSQTAGHNEPQSREARESLIALAGRCSSYLGYADRLLPIL